MSGRSELHHDDAFFAAKRRGDHWCLLSADKISPSHDLMEHQ